MEERTAEGATIATPVRSDARRFRILVQFSAKEACHALASAGQFS
jgi:hypothetical protein